MVDEGNSEENYDHSWTGVAKHNDSIRNEEVRTTSSTGGQKGVKPERHSLIPVEAMDVMARLYGFGAQKYEAHNWRKGYDWSKSYDSLIRHASAFWRGEDIDSETGLPHLAGAAFHCFTLIIFMEEHPEFDDRFKKTISSFAETIDENLIDENLKAFESFALPVLSEDELEYTRLLRGMSNNSLEKEYNYFAKYNRSEAMIRTEIERRNSNARGDEIAPCAIQGCGDISGTPHNWHESDITDGR